jgi:GAF domain-containing protein
VLQSTLPLSAMTSLGAAADLPPGASLLVFDHAGHLVVGDGADPARTQLGNPLVAAALAGRSGAAEAEVPGRSGPRLVAYAPVPEHGWAVLVEQPAGPAFGSLAGLTLRVGLLAGAVALTTLPAAALATRQLRRLYREERRRAEDLGQANRALEAREAELEALRAIDLSVLGVAPLEETLGLARAAVTRLMPADGVGVVLLERDRRTVRWLLDPETRGTRAATEARLPERGPLAEAIWGGRASSGLADPEASEWEADLARDGMASYLVVPLVTAGEVVGAFVVVSSRPAPYREEEVRTAERVAGQVAVALRAVHLAEAERRRAAQLEGIRRLSEAVTASLDLGRVAEAGLERAAEVTGFGAGAVALLEEESRQLVTVATRGLPPEVEEAGRPPGWSGPRRRSGSGSPRRSTMTRCRS